MSFKIELPAQTEQRLVAKARAAGLEVSTYVERVLQADVSGPPLEEVLRPIREAFRESGMTDEELGDLLVKAKKEMRAERRK